jgi:hypothetical protein
VSDLTGYLAAGFKNEQTGGRRYISFT